MRLRMLLFPVLLLLVAVTLGACATQSVAPSVELGSGPALGVALPAPSLTGTVSVEAALAKRRSIRGAYPEKKLTEQQISQLAWAAQGITGPGGKRTAPSAMAVYPLQLFLVMADGAYRYLPEGHKLVKVASGDVRGAVSSQDAVRTAPLGFVIVGDMAKARERFKERAERWTAFEAGAVAENLHLQAVALGLVSLTVGGFTPADAAKALKLGPDQEPIIVIPVGYAK